MSLAEDDPDFCPHFGDGTSKSVCPTCNGHERERHAREAKAHQEDVRIVRSFVARFDFQCRSCGTHHGAGDVCYRDGEGKNYCSCVIPR